MFLIKIVASFYPLVLVGAPPTHCVGSKDYFGGNPFYELLTGRFSKAIRACTHKFAMSALPPKADIAQHGGNVRFVPKADIVQHDGNVRFAP
jgi:hypothetical protein